MKKLTLALLATVFAFTLHASPVVTTVILVRHAEKAAEPANDPPLTEEGLQRAKELARVLGRTDVSVIFSTNLKRTRATAKAIASQLHLEPMLNTPGPTYARDVARRILTHHKGKTILVVGHTNTTRDVIAALGVANPPTIPETEFDNLFIVTLADGADPKLLSLKYGEH
jgi:2,3-bisphosphoglycerate-dependent phosphoglycerate mutase